MKLLTELGSGMADDASSSAHGETLACEGAVHERCRRLSRVPDELAPTRLIPGRDRATSSGDDVRGGATDDDPPEFDVPRPLERRRDALGGVATAL